MKKHIFSGISLLTAAFIAANIAATPVMAVEDNGTKENKTEISAFVQGSYAEYLAKNPNADTYEGWLEFNALELAASENSAANKVMPDNKTDSFILGETNTWGEWQINIPKTALYSVKLEYWCVDTVGTDMQLMLSVDGEVPFKELDPFSLRRSWKSEIFSEEQPFERDENGNDLQSGQQEVHEWISAVASDRSGQYTTPYQIYLTEGSHTIKIKSLEGTLALKSFSLGNDVVVSYKDYLKEHEDKEVKGETLYVQAEQPFRTNNSSIVPVADRLTSSTVPNDPAFIRFNTIGSSGWASQGNSITWEAPVEKAGLYRIAVRARQSANAAMSAYRTILVNGKLPFREAENFTFSYSTKWYMKTLSSEKKEYLFYLEPGDKVSLVCTTGEMAPILRALQEQTTKLNALYLEIISYTSLSPDTFQDYKLDTKIPDLTDRIKNISDNLKTASKQIQKILDSEGSQASTIDYAISILDRFTDAPYLITEQLTAFKTSLETLSSLLQTINSCPLELDYLAFSPVGAEISDSKIGFFKNIAFMVKQFLCSFGDDYLSKKNTEINVWVSTGRDQLQVINSLIRNSFSHKTGIEVNLNIVDTGQTLIRASLAGKGPDAALMMPISVPVNLAARKAVPDLNNYDVETLKEEFYPSAFTPYYYNGGLYALPETQQFTMLFYRTDIFDKYGLSAPKTWDGFFKVMETLQNNNMMVGVPETASENLGVSAGLGIFESLLIQCGGGFYSDDHSKTRFDEQIAYEAFEDWSRFYSDYGLDRQYDFYSRFRTGEMPMAVASLSSYASLQQAAPELQGLWTIAPIPGTVTENGINNSEGSDGTSCIMLNAAVEKGIDKEVMEFLKWWVSSDTQAQYGVMLERTLGIFGRHYTANKVAFKQLAWTSGEREIITAQWEKIYNQPQVPGNYVIQRSLTSALRAVLDNGYTCARALRTYNYEMNEELARKQEEFKND